MIDSMRPFFIAAIVFLMILSSHAQSAPNLAIVAAKAAAAAKRAIPGSEAEAEGSLAVVKKRTTRIPRQDTLGRMDVPDDYGLIFIIRLQHAPYTGQPLPKSPNFDRPPASPLGMKRDIEDTVRHGRQQDAYLRLRGCFRTATMREFPKSNTVMVVEILFGQHTDTQMLGQAYAELTRSVATELGE
jgi:hypothetical protein